MTVFIDKSTLQMLDQKVDFTIIKDAVGRTNIKIRIIQYHHKEVPKLFQKLNEIFYEDCFVAKCNFQEQWLKETKSSFGLFNAALH